MDQIEQVKKLREEYERALDAAESRRSAYHDAVLELYRGGTPLREIAKELGLSHQRVHQIVSGEPPRRSKLPRAAGGAAGVLLILVAAMFGALWLARATPFGSSAPSQVSIPNVVGQPASDAVRHLTDAGLGVRILDVERKPGLMTDEVFAQKGPAGANVDRGSPVTVFVATDRHVAIRPATRFVALRVGRGFVPGGAMLSDARKVLSGVSSIGHVSLWVAPSRVSRIGRCSWLEIEQRGFGGSCYQPANRGIPQVVPFVARGRGGPLARPSSMPLIWGRTDLRVARLTLVFQDGRQASVPVNDGLFLYALSGRHARLKRGHLPAFLVARDAHGRVIDKRPVRLDRAASY
jgi:hypothetical protein